MVGFSKYEFNNKLLGDVTFFRVTTHNLNPTLYFLIRCEF